VIGGGLRISRRKLYASALVNNSTLAGQVQMLSAAELNDLPTNHVLNLGRGDPADIRTLVAFAAKTSFFQYGVTITDLTGARPAAQRLRGASGGPGAGALPVGGTDDRT
jgi:hypothetical protein